MTNTEFSISFENVDNQYSSAFEELIRLLNSDHNVELVDTDKYLFQALYSQIFNQIKDKSVDASFADFSNQIREIFTSELIKINEENQNRFENIMSDREIKAQIIDILSKQVYHHLGNKAINKKGFFLRNKESQY